MAGSRTLKLSILADVDDLKKKLGQGQNEVSSFGDKVSEFGKKAGLAFAAATAAAAAYAGKLLIDGVKSAMEDEKAQARLAETLDNVTGATKNQIAAVEEQISKLSLAYGVTDDELRPSFEKLVRATEDVTKAQKLQTLALDIAAGSGKSLDSVSQALARAYDGNTSALTRLGIGLSAAELKSMSFDDVTKQLSETFGGQAARQADTFQGKITRLQVAFDEAKESVGARLIPILTDLITKFMDNVGPAIDFVKEKVAPLTKAIEDNKEEFQALWSFLDKYIVPIITGALKLAFGGLVSSITLVINGIGKAVNFFQDLYDKYKQLIDFLKNNPLSKWLGKLDFNPFNNTSFSNANFVVAGNGGNEDTTGGGGGGGVGIHTVMGGQDLGPWTITIRGRAINVPYGMTYEQAYAHAERVVAGIERKEELIAKTAEIRARVEGRQIGTNETTTSGITINVNAPSVIDSEGFTRSVIDALNQSEFRTGSLGTLLI